LPQRGKGATNGPSSTSEKRGRGGELTFQSRYTLPFLSKPIGQRSEEVLLEENPSPAKKKWPYTKPREGPQGGRRKSAFSPDQGKKNTGHPWRRRAESRSLSWGGSAFVEKNMKVGGKCGRSRGKKGVPIPKAAKGLRGYEKSP